MTARPPSFGKISNVRIVARGRFLLLAVSVSCPQALLWTDGRYHLQAEQQLGAGWTLMKAGNPSVPTIKKFLSERLPPSSRVGVDPFVHSAAFIRDLEEVPWEMFMRIVDIHCYFSFSPCFALRRKTEIFTFLGATLLKHFLKESHHK